MFNLLPRDTVFYDLFEGMSGHGVKAARYAQQLAENFPNIPRDNIEGMKASDVIQQSLDLVEFVLHLEEKLGLEININTLGEKLITETFGELADDLVAIGKGA